MYSTRSGGMTANSFSKRTATRSSTNSPLSFIAALAWAMTKLDSSMAER